MDQNIGKQLANHLRGVYFGGNWTSVNLHDTLADVTWQEAVTQVHALNTIATLLYHVNYYVDICPMLTVFTLPPLIPPSIHADPNKQQIAFSGFLS